MKSKKEHSSPNPGKTNLTRDELLAGKCGEEMENPAAPDPRIKSPDELIEQLKRLTSEKKEKNIPQKESTDMLPMPTTIATPEPKSPLPDVWQTNFNQLKNKYDQEKTIWMKYVEDIKSWKEQIESIFQNKLLKIQAQQDEIQDLKKTIEQKDHDLETFKSKLNASVRLSDLLDNSPLAEQPVDQSSNF